MFGVAPVGDCGAEVSEGALGHAVGYFGDEGVRRTSPLPPLGDGVHVAFTVPARTRVQHVWTYWGEISGQMRPALAAQHRLGRSRGLPNPVQVSAWAEARGVA